MPDYRYLKDDDCFVIERWDGTQWEYTGSVYPEDVAIDMCKHSRTLQGLRELALDMGFSYRFIDRLIDSVDSHNGFISDDDYRCCVDYLLQSSDGLM